MAYTKITIAAAVSAEASRVWDFWTQPEHITKWNFATDDWHCPYTENDLKVGGKYLARMEAKDGSFGFDFEAVYDEVIEREKIAYTMGDGRRAITRFEDLGGTTQVTTTFDAESSNPVEMQRAGWQAILDNFKRYAELHGDS
jgi:uncharacterized protein YndB with AHSA1/START domain